MRRTNRTLDKTFLDHLGLWIAPVLVVLFVGSFVFFLVEISDSSSGAWHLKWTMFWFVVGAVLVSRISIQFGSERAALYGMGLGAAAAVKLTGQFGYGWFTLVFMLLVWWATSRLVWNTTVVEELDQEETPTFLSQMRELRKGFFSREKPLKWSERFRQFFKRYIWRSPEAGLKSEKPGVWLINLGSVTLLLFGFCQGLLNSHQKQSFGFLLLLVHLGAGIVLLAVSGFLDFRRELRGRFLQMEPGMAANWWWRAVSMMALFALLAIALPKPNEPKVWLGLDFFQARQIPPPNQENQETREGESAEPGGEKTAGKEESKKSGVKEGKPSQNQNDGRRSGGERVGSSSALPNLFALFKWIALVIVLVLAFLNRDLLKSWVAGVFEFFRNSFRTKPADPVRALVPGGERVFGTKVGAAEQIRSPLDSRGELQVSLEQALDLSFRAVEIWAARENMPRLRSETPVEFARRLLKRGISFSDGLNGLLIHHQRLVYAGEVQDLEAIEAIKVFWRQLPQR